MRFAACIVKSCLQLNGSGKSRARFRRRTPRDVLKSERTTHRKELPFWNPFPHRTDRPSQSRCPTRIDHKRPFLKASGALLRSEHHERRRRTDCPHAVRTHARPFFGTFPACEKHSTPRGRPRYVVGLRPRRSSAHLFLVRAPLRRTAIVHLPTTLYVSYL